MIPNRNALWGRIIVDEFARAGVRELCLSPGSRSAPIAFATATQPNLRVTVHHDERGAAYFALGAAKATGRPVALVCTSGTAGANYFPAVIEASESLTPLIILSADRPPELRGTGANQTIDQRDLFGRHVRAYTDLPLPEPVPARARDLRAAISRAAATAKGPRPGPVHLNQPFREPLDPGLVPGDVPASWAGDDQEAEQGRSDGAPWIEAGPASPTTDEASLATAWEQIGNARRGLIIAGPRPQAEEGEAALASLESMTGFPLLADPASGARFCQEPAAFSNYDAFLSNATLRSVLRPDLVIRVGAASTSKALLQFLHEHPDVPQLIIDEGSAWTEAAGSHATILRTPLQSLTDSLSPSRPAPDAVWQRTWNDAQAIADDVMARDVPHRAFEGRFVRELLGLLGPGSIVVVGNSMPIRDVDRFSAPETPPLRIIANRGASGIEGLLSTALGVAHAARHRVFLLIGDQSLVHDLNALVTLRRLNLPVTVVCIDNDGAGIFEFLAHASHDPPFTELFVAPHGADLSAVAKAAGLEATTLTVSATPEGIHRALGQAQFIHVKSDRKANVRHRREVETNLTRALDAHPWSLSHAH